jgi:hypothetical protein
MEGSLWKNMILSILTLCNDEGKDINKDMEYDNDNDMVNIIQPNKKVKGKQNNLVKGCRGKGPLTSTDGTLLCCTMED